MGLLFRSQAPTATTEAERVRAAFTLWRDSFHPYQQELFSEESDFALRVKARQIGFSHTIAGDALRRAILERTDNIILSASQELSSEVLDKAKMHAEVLLRLGVQAARPVVSNATRLELAGGGRVIALPASKKTARSFTGNVYLDEFAYHEDPKGIWDAAAGQATRGNFKIRVISTPNGAQGLFYDWSVTPPAGWSVKYVYIDDARREGMRVDLDRLWKLAGGDERIFGQWYRCIFLDAALQYIPTAMANRARDWEGAMPSDLSGAEFFAGLDVGRENDLTALVVVAVLGRYAYVVSVSTCRRTRFRAQRKMIREARELFGWKKLCVDANGIGKEMAEELVTQWGEGEVVPVNFTMQDKEDLATRALRWFRDDRLRFPRGDEGKKLHAETIAVRRVVTPAGNVTYDVPRTSQGHGDRWWGLTLALKGAGEPIEPRGLGQEPLLAVA